MKKYFIAVLIIAITGIILFNTTEWFREEPQTLKAVAKAAIGTNDDPQARFNHQIMKLRNPKTGKIPEDIRNKELKFATNLPVRNPDVAVNKFGKALVVSNDWQLRGPYNVGGRTRALAIDATNEDVLLAGGVSGGMWRSTDGGVTWLKTTDPGQLHSVTCLVQDTRSGKTDTWYYGTGEYRGNSASPNDGFFLGDGIFKSTDGGINWTPLASTSNESPHRFNQAFDIVWNMAVDPSNTTQDEVYAAAYGVIYRSLDGGTSWTAVLYPSDNNLNNARYTDIAVTSTGVVYVTMSSGHVSSQGIWRSTTGQNGSFVNITPAGWPPEYRRIVLSIAPSDEDVVYFLADTEGYGTSNHSLWKYEYLSGDGTGSGGQWSDRSANIPEEGGYTGDFDSQSSYNLLIKVKPDNENTVFIGGINLYRSINGFETSPNVTWIGGYDTGNDTYANYENHHADQHALVFYPSNNSKVISGHDGGLSITDDIMAGTVIWQTLNNGYYTTQFYTCAIDYETENSNLILGGMQDNGTYMISSVSPTAAWSQQLGGDGAFCAIGDATVAKNLYISAQNGLIYRMSSFEDANWSRVDPEGAADYLFINPFILDRNNTKSMYLAGGSVIWRNSDLTAIPLRSSDPATVNWTELTNTQLDSGSVSALEISTTPANRLYYGTSLGDVFRLDDASSGNPSPVNITSNAFPNGYVNSIAVDPTNADNVMLAFSNYEVISVWYSNNGGGSWQNISGNLEEVSDGTGSGPAVNWVEILPTNQGTIFFAGTTTGLYSSIALNGNSTVWLMEGATDIGNVVVDMVDSRMGDDLVVVATHGNGMFSANVSVTSALEEEPDLVAGKFELIQNYPNPFNPNTTIEYSIPQASTVSLKIYNIQGQEIATLVNSDHPAGKYTVSWNGKDHFGRPAASGTYIYQIVAGKYRESKQMVLMK